MDNNTQQAATGWDETLVTAYEQSKRARSQARRSITLLILGVVIVYISLMWRAIVNFEAHRMPEFGAALSVEAGQLAPRVTRDLKVMAERLYPLYVDAFQKMFERDWPRMKEQGLKEMGLLQSHAYSRWPKIQSALMDVVTTAEVSTRKELAAIVDERDLEKISVAYGEALNSQLESLLKTTLKEHVEVAEKIGDNLIKITATEPDIKPPIDLRYNLGMMLELIGTEMQSAVPTISVKGVLQ